MPDLIRHPVPFWIRACAGMTALPYLIAGVIIKKNKLGGIEDSNI
jgi:hypothetical protein